MEERTLSRKGVEVRVALGYLKTYCVDKRTVIWIVTGGYTTVLGTGNPFVLKSLTRRVGGAGLKCNVGYR